MFVEWYGGLANKSELSGVAIRSLSAPIDSEHNRIVGQFGSVLDKGFGMYDVDELVKMRN